MINSILIAVPVTLLNAEDGTPTGDSFALPTRSTVLAWQTSFNEAPDAIDIDLEVSIDNSVWAVLDTSTAVGGELRTITTPTAALFIRAIVNTNTGNKEITLTLVAKVAVP